MYLWGWKVSGFAPLLERAQAALGTMMANYPAKWVPTSCDKPPPVLALSRCVEADCAWPVPGTCSNGIAMQRARIILPLAFLVRANGTAEHRQWLQTAVDGFLTRQHCEGTWCAYKEELSHPGWGGSTRVPNNDDCAHKLLTFASGLVGLTRRSRSQTERLRRRSTRPTRTRSRTSSVR